MPQSEISMKKITVMYNKKHIVQFFTIFFHNESISFVVHDCLWSFELSNLSKLVTEYFFLFCQEIKALNSQ